MPSLCAEDVSDACDSRISPSAQGISPTWIMFLASVASGVTKRRMAFLPSPTDSRYAADAARRRSEWRCRRYISSAGSVGHLREGQANVRERQVRKGE